MKKILTVALSTAMAFSMFASVAFGDTAVTPQQKFDALAAKGIFNGYPDKQAHLEKEMTRAEFAKVITKLLGLKEVTGTLSYKDKGYDAKNWAVPYIEAVTAAGIMQGQDSVKKIFNYNGKVTIQEMATVLTRALKLEIPANPDNNAADWAKGYVQAAINKGLISKDANFKANASRSQLVEAAYAIDQAANITFTYKVVDPSNVEFTLSTGEVVKVKLDKPLEANKETEVKFKDAAGNEYTAKVTWVVTSATKVESVSANNLKQVTVKFDGTVEEQSAEDVKNYKLTKNVESAELSEDGKSVLLTLGGEYAADSNKFDNQKEVKITVDGVRSSDKTRTIKQELKFTPTDVTIPAVKEVVGLGTKAFKVVFSEPVDKGTAISTANYKIDGKAISGSVDYAYPDAVIVSTALTTGDHKLTVSNVKDFAEFKVVPVETSFTVVEDKEAPTVVSSKSNDLTSVELEFNEPVKSVGKIYNGISSKTGTVKITDNKVKVTFTKANALSVNENTLVVEGVTDYSGNSANREVKITPTLDTERPEVDSISSDVDANGNTVISVKYSEAVINATEKGNYTIKKDGKVVVGKGLDASGHPVKSVAYDSNKKVATITLVGALDKATYTLEISGIQDAAYVPNTILPYTGTLEIGDTAAPTLKKAWVETSTANTQGERDVYFYVTFSKPMAVDGTGSVLENAKYNIKWTASSSTYEALPTNATVENVTPETVRITVPSTKKAVDNQAEIRVTLVADQAGNFAYSNNGYVGNIPVTASNQNVITASDVKAVSRDTVSVKFNGILTGVDANDFAVRVGATDYAVSVKSSTQDGGNTVVEFGLSDDYIPADALNTTFRVKATTPNTQDAFGVKVASNISAVVNDSIAPESKDITVGNATYELQVKNTGGNQYQAIVEFNEAITAVPGTGDVSVDIPGVDVSGVAIDDNGTQLLVNFTTDKALTDDSVIVVSLGSSNATSKVVKDAKGNAAKEFSRDGVYGTVKTN